jgi:hypothetical protein
MDTYLDSFIEDLEQIIEQLEDLEAVFRELLQPQNKYDNEKY